MASLYDVVKTSYGDENSLNTLKKQGYEVDKDYSNDEYTTLYNSDTNKMIFTTAGTHKIGDVGTDIALATGNLKSTGRYKRAHQAIRGAKDKYNPSNTSVVGHSLGSSISQGIASKGDNVVTLDGGYTIGQGTKGTHYRTSGDAVSALGSGAKHTKTLPHKKSWGESLTGAALSAFSPLLGAGYNAYNAHNVSNVKDESIFV